jgi:hypothetical protein
MIFERSSHVSFSGSDDFNSFLSDEEIFENVDQKTTMFFNVHFSLPTLGILSMHMRWEEGSIQSMDLAIGV